MTQIITNSNWGWGSSSSWDMKKSVYDPQNIESDAFDYNNFTNTPDLSDYQTTANLVTDLSNPDNTHYPSAKAVSDAISWAWAGDMLKSVYDPNSVEANAFDYNNFINTPDIPTDTSELTNWAWFITGIDSWDVTTALWYTPYNATNPNGYVTDSIINDTAYWAWWDSDTTHAPTKNAVYDKISAMDTTISWKADSSSLGTAATKNTWTSSGNVPVLDANGKLSTTILPALAITDTFTVSTTSDLTGLSSAEKWDVAIVTWSSETYILSADPYSTSANWKKLATPADTVTSVNSKTWAVTLDADDISDTSTTHKFVTTQTAYTSKWTSTKVPTITTNSLGQVTAISETSIDYPSQVDDTAYASSWDWVTATAPSKNAVYDKISAMDTTIGWKQSQHSSISVTLSSSSWSSSTQTVTATGVTASNTVIVSPEPTSFTNYCSAWIYCSAQASNSLTFTCTDTPSSNITVNVIILN